MHGHPCPERGHLLGEAVPGLEPQALDPVLEGPLRGLKQPVRLFRGELRGEAQWREACGVQDFVRVRVADTVEQSRIGERALQRVGFAGQGGAELLRRRPEYVEAARIVGRKRGGPAHQVQRRAVLRGGFRQEEAPAGKVPGSEIRAAGNPYAGRLPVESAGDHQVQHGEVIAVESEHDALAETADLLHPAPGQVGHRGVGSPEQEGARDAHALEALPHDPVGEGLLVQEDVRQLGHAPVRSSAQESPGQLLQALVVFHPGARENALYVGAQLRLSPVITGRLLRAGCFAGAGRLEERRGGDGVEARIVSCGQTVIPSRRAATGVLVHKGSGHERQPRGWYVLCTVRRYSRSTCVYSCVVARSAWPSISCTARRSAPPSSKCVAKVWRKV